MAHEHDLHDLLAATRHPQRLIALDAVHNFRDLGGYPAADGRTTRWRTLFRADGLYRLTTDDLEVVRTLQLRTVIDLRTEQELTNSGRFPLEYHPITFHHVPVIDSTWTGLPQDEVRDRDPAEFLEWAYLDMLNQTPERFARAFEHLCEAEVLPAVFHCAAGKDRTGVAAALLLGLLGVDDDTIVADYGLSQAAMARALARIQARPDAERILAGRPLAAFEAPTDAVIGFVAAVRESYGDWDGAAQAIGVGPDTVARLRSLLLGD